MYHLFINNKFIYLLTTNYYNTTIHNRKLSNSVLEALASCTFCNMNVSPVSYNTLSQHPLTFFAEGIAQKR